jgi:predicted RNA-binding protein (virulence factor B family)
MMMLFVQGDRMRGYIKNVRPDNKIDVSLQIQGYESIEPNAINFR